MSDKISLKLDPDNLTIGDLEDFEEITGISMDKALKPVPVIDDETGEVQRDAKGRPVKAVQVSAKSLKAIVYIVQRKDVPGFTLADAAATRVGQLEITGNDDDDAESTGEDAPA